jgi:hypothetical protein
VAGVLHKWKKFFEELEVHFGLNINLDAHIWLLHHLFLPLINEDLALWLGSWNNHTLARRGERHRTPSHMYIHGQVEHGQRGLFIPSDEHLSADEYGEDFAGYGIDWDELDDEQIQNFHDARNPDDGDAANPFMSAHPEHLSHVEVTEARCPLHPEQIKILDQRLRALPHFGSPDTASRQLLWIDALEMASQLA